MRWLLSHLISILLFWLLQVPPGIKPFVTAVQKRDMSLIRAMLNAGARSGDKGYGLFKENHEIQLILEGEDEVRCIHLNRNLFNLRYGLTQDIVEPFVMIYQTCKIIFTSES